MKIEITIKNRSDESYKVTVSIKGKKYDRVCRNDYTAGIFVGEIVQSALIDKKGKN